MPAVRSFQCARCGEDLPPGGAVSHCPCGGPLWARYDLGSVRGRLRPGAPGEEGVWRYRLVLPDCDPIRLGEGGTPLLRANRLETEVGIREVWVKDESRNPTGSFKARGAAVAVAAARAAGRRKLAIASAGNAAAALSAYAARAGLEAHCFLPEDTPRPVQEEVRAYGARLYPVPGPLSEAAARVREMAPDRGWFDVSTFREPFRLEGKKTMGYELAEQTRGDLPDWILYPTGGGVGVMGLWKAFAELEEIGWIGRSRPRLAAVQPSGCAPLVRAFETGADRPSPWEAPRTVAVGLRVPVCAAGDILLRILRESGGTAVAVPDDEIRAGAAALCRDEGVCAGPEGGAAAAALRRLRAAGILGPEDRVVLFNTGWGAKYD